MFFKEKKYGYMCVEISKEKEKEVEDFVEKIIKKKEQESHHKIDPYNEKKRFMTGFLGEAALEEVLGVKLMDWTIGDSSTYNVPDLEKLGLNIGVKTVEKGKHHIIHTNPKRPEIMVYRDTKYTNRLIILGVATVENMKQNQNRDLILSPYLKKRREKTAFCGYKHIKPFSNIKELEEIIKKAN